MANRFSKIQAKAVKQIGRCGRISLLTAWKDSYILSLDGIAAYVIPHHSFVLHADRIDTEAEINADTFMAREEQARQIEITNRQVIVNGITFTEFVNNGRVMYAETKLLKTFGNHCSYKANPESGSGLIWIYDGNDILIGFIAPANI